MDTEEFWNLIEGVPNKDDEKKNAQEYCKIIRDEFKKLSKGDVFGQNLKAVYLVELIIDAKSEDKYHPKYRVYANGTDDKDLEVLINAAIQQFVDEDNYAFHYNYDQLDGQIPIKIQRYLNTNTNTDEYWCKLLFKGMTLSGNPSYPCIVLCFDKIGLETRIQWSGKKHPFLDSLKREWTFGRVNDLINKKVCYNELFRRAATSSDHFIYLYGDVFNTLSTLKYENESNIGSILKIKETREEGFDKLQSNYDISICFKQPISVEEDSYKKIRKLLEVTNDSLSLLMNGNDEIFAIGKMIENPSCEYYQVRFEEFMKWTLYKNKEKFLCFENMIPRIPDTERGITESDIILLKKTFNITDTSIYERIIEEAVFQQHGTMVVFAENASDESERLNESGIRIEPTDICKAGLVKAVSTIDGAIICDPEGLCYSIGTILDGSTSKQADSSRGARYNSAKRYIEQQKEKEKNTFIVVVSEDGYVNCFSTNESK